VELVDDHTTHFKAHILGEDGSRTADPSQHARHKQARVEVSADLLVSGSIALEETMQGTQLSR